MKPPLRPLTNSGILTRYLARTQESARLYQRALRLFPSGLTHDSRLTDPHPVFVARADGPRKWDADGNEYVDYFGGHGALILGHNHKKVTQAVAAQLARGTHYGAEHALAVEWAERIQAMVPSAERLRFTNSGTEATLLALRLARAFTGKPKVVRFLTHFHGWHDHLIGGYHAQFDGSAPPGVAAAIAEDILPAAPDDLHDVRALLEDRDDVAAIILEPTGASFGKIPMAPEALRTLRAVTAARGVVLIFDEVITGFRVAPGGAQAAFGVTPDLTTLAKIVAGGLPGGVLAGRKDLLDLMDFDAAEAQQRPKVQHLGTFNGNPLSAAAGIATLDIVAGTDACDRANGYADRLRAAMNGVLAEEGVNWAVYGTFSGFHVFTNPLDRALDPRSFAPGPEHVLELRGQSHGLVNRLRLAMAVEGVELNGWPGGLTSAVHGDAELEQTVAAFRASLQALREEGDIA